MRDKQIIEKIIAYVEKILKYCDSIEEKNDFLAKTDACGIMRVQYAANG